MAFRNTDSVCFESRSSWAQPNLRLDLPDVSSLQMLPDRLPSLSEYIQDDFPSPQLKEDFEGNLIVQLDKEYPRSIAQDVLPRSCFDVLNNQGRTMPAEAPHSLISTSLATIAGYQSTWPNLAYVPVTSIDNFSASMGTSVAQSLPRDRNSPFLPSLSESAATFRELSSANYVSIQNQSFQSNAFPPRNNFHGVSSMGGLPISLPDDDRFNAKPVFSSAGSGYGGQELLRGSWSGYQQQHNPGSMVTSSDRKPVVLESSASPPELSNDYTPRSLERDCSVTWSTGSLSSSGLARVDNRAANTPPLRKRALESTGHLEDAEARKLEMKRAKNREAAQRCQQRKQERIVRLEGKVGKLKEQNVALTQTVRGLREQITWLQSQIVTHTSNGCQLSTPRFFAS